MIEGIIFDKDGIVFDTEPYYARSNIQALARHGVNLTEEEYYSFWTRDGGSLESYLAGKGRDHLNYHYLSFERRRILNEMLEERLPLIEGVAGVIKLLSQEFPLSLVTSSHKEDTFHMLQLAGLLSYFNPVITAQDVKNKKPHPEGFLLASEGMGIDPSNVVVIEDAEKGVIAAKEAGMKCVAIPTAYTKENDFSRVDVVLDDVRKLTKRFIDGLK